ncbi:elongation factor Ts, mitochondrial [Euphorbia lathyris]|uniref:elongation factor Ts, mitochondrial n=1 Tax=Euphorbia lathyris TaxID=212925 RepID=UPI0033133CBA
MALCRSAKRPLQMMLSTRVANTGQNYSTRTAVSLSTSQFADTKSVSESAFGSFFRRFSSKVPAASEQMDLIKQLRVRTSAPIKDVKAALVDCNWDIEAAQKDLRKKGMALASKKSGRMATEGLLALAQNEGKAALIELNCETDFVAKNEIFQYLALSLAKQALLTENTSKQGSGVHPVGLECLEDLKLNLEHPKISGETTVQDAITQVAAIMGENVRLRRGFVMSTASGVLSTYLHTSPQPGLGRFAGLISLEVEDGNSQVDALQRVGSELAMHVVAAKPLFLTKELVSTEALETELEVLRSQAESTGKPKFVIDKMVEGRLRKYYEEVALMEQNFIINDAINVQTLLKNLSNEVGSPVKIGSFLRMEVGEGIERLEASGADEPVAQAA